MIECIFYIGMALYCILSLLTIVVQRIWLNRLFLCMENTMKELDVLLQKINEWEKEDRENETKK